ncbi:MAG: tRNA pseudouridine(55) synthase TruB [Anaerolineae bacterium]|nr:tRNA pseudouridine(55) synthase TruB [Anaerolineae bacterium]
MTGILNIDKPAGITSHDVVDAVRRIAGQRKVGHAGTLDPMATGVLLVCLGQATRVSEYLMAGRKRYRATLVFGSETDTYDADGEVMRSGTRTDFRREEIEVALAAFRGPIKQVPPVYSALKRDGRPLHRLAREGKARGELAVVPHPRPVEIDAVEILAWTEPELILEITCSPGTYIRSLAHDLGHALNSSAYLGALVRLQSGHFTLHDAVSLERLEEAFRHGEEGRYLLPIDEAVLDWPALVLNDEQTHRLVQGGAVPGDRPGGEDAAPGHARTLARAYSLDGEFLALVIYQPDSGEWQPKKVFATADGSD